MRLYLKNIGMIKEADVKLDGLTVIAGENDTGKSTVGKSLVALIKSDLIALKKHKKKFWHNRKYGFNVMINLLFENFAKRVGSNESIFKLYFDERGKNVLDIFYKDEYREYYFSENSVNENFNRPLRDITYIQSPIIWDLENFFSAISQFKEQIGREESRKDLLAFDFKYPYLLWDLYGKFIKSRSQKQNLELASKITNIIGGDFEKFSGGSFVFRKNDSLYPLIQVAHGIKSFGTLQVLIRNGHLNKFNFLIIDEPEVHLHPKWQIEYAKILVELVKRDVKVLVTSHSPYMIEALKKYSDFFSLNNKTAFYLSEDNNIYQLENSNSLTLERIFYKLSEPFDNLDELEENEKNV